MLRGLYRFYLYTVFIAMLFFGATGIEGLLQTALGQVIFKDPNSTLTQSTIVQAIVYAIVSLLTTALFGGLHYWLIRRDMRGDPAAGNGAVRAFFLNTVEFVTLPLAAGIGSSTIAGLGVQYSGGASFGLAFSITMLLVWLVLELERRRVPAQSGVAHIFQRLHFYGTQLLLLFILTTLWLSSIGLLVDDVIFHGHGVGLPVCGGFTVCPGPNLLSQLVGTFLIVAFWLGYSWLSRHDTTSFIRKVLHFFSFGYGFVALLIGIYRGVSLMLLAILHAHIDPRSISGPFAQYDIVSPLTLGLLVVGLYLYWLRSAARQHGATEQVAFALTAQAITTALTSIAFWFGSGLLLLNLLERVIPSNTTITTENWANAIALIVTGSVYIPFDIILRRRSKQAAFTAPLRGFVFALFGGGILTSAIGGATALYAYSTSLLGSPLDNWQYTAHSGLAALAVGITIVGLYLWISLREHFFSSATGKQNAAPTLTTSTPPIMPQMLTATEVEQEHTSPTQAIASPIADIIDELLAGNVTRDTAIAKIESLVKQGV